MFFELFRDEDPSTAGMVVQALDKDTIRRLMKPVPAQLRFTLNPEELLAKLDITGETDVSALTRGITILLEEPSGNYIIDEPYIHRMYQVVATRGRPEARDMVRVLQETPFPLEGFIQQQGRAAVALLDNDLEATLRLVRGSDPLLSPPARIIHRLVYADPVLAARLITALNERGEADLVLESLAYLAYDKDRSERIPELPISLEQDGKFLRALLSHQGVDGLAGRLGEVFQVYGQRVARNEVPSDFLSQFRDTLDAAVSTLPNADIKRNLQGVIQVAAHGGNPGG